MKVAQRLFSSLDLFRVHEMQEVVVVEPAEGATKRVETIQKHPHEQQECNDGDDDRSSELLRDARTVDHRTCRLDRR